MDDGLCIIALMTPHPFTHWFGGVCCFGIEHHHDASLITFAISVLFSNVVCFSMYWPLIWYIVSYGRANVSEIYVIFASGDSLSLSALNQC